MTAAKESPVPGPNGRSGPSAHQLRLFLTLAEEPHFGRATARMFMTQPAFSQQIRGLERKLGLQLVERTTRAVRGVHLQIARGQAIEGRRRRDRAGALSRRRGRGTAPAARAARWRAAGRAGGDR
ncbi:helix-turn-helix domain-containing protein [Streptomyces sp. NPDC002067]